MAHRFFFCSFDSALNVKQKMPGILHNLVLQEREKVITTRQLLQNFSDQTGSCLSSQASFDWVSWPQKRQEKLQHILGGTWHAASVSCWKIPAHFLGKLRQPPTRCKNGESQVLFLVSSPGIFFGVGSFRSLSFTYGSSFLCYMIRKMILSNVPSRAKITPLQSHIRTKNYKPQGKVHDSYLRLWE